jgi:voltage-gated potassium channel Kch
MMSDDDLEKLSYQLDDLLGSLMVKYQVPPLSLAAIVVARLAHLNIAADCVGDFKKLMIDIATRDLPEPKTGRVH